MTVRESLLAISPYPLPADYIESVGTGIGLDLDSDVEGIDNVKVFYRAKAMVYYFLATTPNVSEGGVSISFNANDKSLFLAMARKYAGLAGDDSLIPGPAYGYKGENI